MYATIYFEINLVSVLVLLIILFKFKTSGDRQAASIAYIRVVMAIVVILLLDTVWITVDGRPGRSFIALNAAINSGYLFTMSLISYLWLQFVLLRLHRKPRERSHERIIITLPLIAVFALCALSPWVPLLYDIGADNVYHRGKLVLIQQLISYLYMAAAGTYSLVSALKERNRERRSEGFTLFSFIILPSIGSVISFFVYGLPVIWPLTTVSILIVFLNLQGQQISTDELTGLNNRRQFDRYLLAQTEDLRHDDRLYLLLIDIDSFKKINDTFGHQAGDAALAQAAAILKQECGVWDCFLARYGGDEFAIVFKSHDPSRLAQFKSDLTSAFERFSSSGATPYRLSISIGASMPSSDSLTPQQLIAMADASLYEAKAQKKDAGR